MSRIDVFKFCKYEACWKGKNELCFKAIHACAACNTSISIDVVVLVINSIARQIMFTSKDKPITSKEKAHTCRPSDVTGSVFWKDSSEHVLFAIVGFRTARLYLGCLWKVFPY